MSRTTMGPLFSDIRGKIGGVVTSKWKGIPTIRSRVTPANPQSAGQVAQRTALTIVTASWKSLQTAQQTLWNNEASGKQYSGFNAFAKANIAQEKAGDWQVMTPPEPDVDNIDTFAAAGGAGSGEIDVTWAQGALDPADVVKLAVRKQETGSLTFAPDQTADGASYTFTGLEPGETYAVYGYGIDGDGNSASTLYTTAVATA